MTAVPYHCNEITKTGMKLFYFFLPKAGKIAILIILKKLALILSLACKKSQFKSVGIDPVMLCFAKEQIIG